MSDTSTSPATEAEPTVSEIPETDCESGSSSTPGPGKDSERTTKRRIRNVLALLLLWVHVVGLYFLPFHTAALITTVSVASGVFLPRFASRMLGASATVVADLGERGARLQERLDELTASAGLPTSRLVLNEQEAVSARWLRGTDTLAITRGARDLPADQLDALLVMEVVERASWTRHIPVAYSWVRILSTAALRVGAVVVFAGEFSWWEAVLVTALLYCLGRVFHTSKPAVADVVSRVVNPQVLARLGGEKSAYRQALVRIRESVSDDADLDHTHRDSCDRRINRLDRLST